MKNPAAHLVNGNDPIGNLPSELQPFFRKLRAGDIPTSNSIGMPGQLLDDIGLPVKERAAEIAANYVKPPKNGLIVNFSYEFISEDHDDARKISELQGYSEQQIFDIQIVLDGEAFLFRNMRDLRNILKGLNRNNSEKGKGNAGNNESNDSPTESGS